MDETRNQADEIGKKNEDEDMVGYGLKGYQRHYSEAVFWNKLVRFTTRAGKAVTEKALMLFYISKSEKTPMWAKSLIFGALGYFINTLDAVPDLVPLIGFADDLGVLAAVIALLAKSVSPEVERQVDLQLSKWFQSDNNAD